MKLSVSAIAITAVIGMSSIAVAQQEKQPPPSNQTTTQRSGGTQGDTQRSERQNRASQPSQKEDSSAEGTKLESPKRTSEDSTEQRSTQQRRSQGYKDGRASNRAENAKRDRNQETGSEEASKKKSDNTKSVGQKRETNQSKDASEGRTTSKQPTKNADRGSRVHARAEINQQQSTRVRSIIRQQNVKNVTGVNVSVSIGSTIPRRVELRRLPAAVVEIVPAYRDYRYVVIEDRICIVDPVTYKIVYVIDESGSGIQSASLELTAKERRIILQRVDFRHPADVQYRLAMGAEVPSSVEVHAFPAAIVDQVPKLKRYRYVAVNDAVLIIPRDSRHIELIVERH